MKKATQLFFFLIWVIQVSGQETSLATSDFDNAYIKEIKTENTALTERINAFPENIKELNKKIGQAIRDNDDSKALELAYETDKLYPNNADIKNFIGKRQSKAQDYLKAIKSFDEAIKLNSKNKWFYVNKASAQAENKQLNEALKTIETLIVLQPNWSIAYNLKASFLRELNQQSESLRAYEMALMVEPKSAQIYANRGDLYKELSKEKEAISDYKMALQIQPDYSRAQERLNMISKAVSEKK